MWRSSSAARKISFGKGAGRSEVAMGCCGSKEEDRFDQEALLPKKSKEVVDRFEAKKASVGGYKAPTATANGKKSDESKSVVPVVLAEPSRPKNSPDLLGVNPASIVENSSPSAVKPLNSPALKPASPPKATQPSPVKAKAASPKAAEVSPPKPKPSSPKPLVEAESKAPKPRSAASSPSADAPLVVSAFTLGESAEVDDGENEDNDDEQEQESEETQTHAAAAPKKAGKSKSKRKKKKGKK